MIGATGVIFAAYYMLPMVQRMFFNALDKDENRSIPDLSRREIIVLAPLLAGMIWLGFYPKPFLERMEASVVHIVESAGVRSAPARPIEGPVSIDTPDAPAEAGLE
jgi:NADH-quinone oxidoreductase subunit M